MKKIKNTVCLFAIVCLTACTNNHSVLEKYGIVNDGKTINTKALQKAIDDCSLHGGGVVSLTEGEYLTGTLVLKENVTLHVEKGAVISGSRDMADYPDKGRRKALIFAENVKNISLSGEGEINGNGASFTQENNAPDRPTLILLLDCEKVAVNGIKMTNSGFWTFRFVRCDGVNIRQVSVEGHANWNNDGFDIESKNVIIADCVLDTDDDAICFKSEDPDYVVENVTVENCRLASNCNFIKFGTASAGGFRHIKVSHCTLEKCSRSLFRFWEKQVPGVTDSITGIAGIALEVVDGGFMEDITISDIVMEDVQTPVFIRLGKRKVSDNTYLKDFLIENITASSVSFVASSITGVPGLRVENGVIRNIDLKLKAGGKVADVHLKVPEAEAAYPENRMFDVMLPAYGFYLRHAGNILFDNIQLSTTGGKEERPAVFAEDVDGLTIRNSSLQSPDSDLPVVYLKSCKNYIYE
ncbi:MAG: polygalacturonase [Candidatus Symbiothrix sp.]|jgi:polygalacturonase|nr:polygalacturonase [Candidatus Symbiothrix sp.]